MANFKSNFYTLLTCLLLFSSCKSTKVDVIHLEKNGEVIISMERTPCFGTCPTYKADIYSNGLLLYNGKKYSPYLGCYYTALQKKEVEELVGYIQSSGFFGLENKYPVEGRGPSDLPGCNVYFKHGSMEKRIEDRGWHTPLSLLAVEKRIDSIIASKRLHFCDK
jgi:hypothetical protein